jgi:hypothetical protein
MRLELPLEQLNDVYVILHKEDMELPTHVSSKVEGAFLPSNILLARVL